MDQPRSEPTLGAAITLPPDMRPATAPGPAAGPRRGDLVASLFVGCAGILLGLAALGALYWQHDQTQREILRLSTEVAQLRVSLELYARNAARTEPTPSEPVAEPVLPPIAAPAAEPVPAEPAASASNEDCLPAGMRLLVAAGDSYPVCQQTISVDVAAVDNGYVMLTDGTTIPSGSTMPILGSSCTIGVTSGGDEGLTGYAEIRVTC